MFAEEGAAVVVFARRQERLDALRAAAKQSEADLREADLRGTDLTGARLRGTRLDIFGRSAERRLERALIGEYEKTISLLLNKLDGGNVDLAADIASIPEHIRGYGHVKEAHLHKAKVREAELLKEWDNPLRVVQAA